MATIISGLHLRLMTVRGSGLLLLLLWLHSLGSRLAPRGTTDTWRPLGGGGLGLGVLQFIQLGIGQAVLVPVGAREG